MGGVEFEGTVDPTVVEQLLDRMERVFEQLECSNVAKFKYAISLLQKDAYDWWVSVLNAKVKPYVLTWDDFLKEFRMKYVPPAYCDVKKKEFLNLRQRGMSITKDEQKFLRLSCYVGGIIKEEKDKCRKFEDGVNDSIRKNVAILQHEKFCKPRVPTCPQCGNNHYGTCRRASSACFSCGSFDHKVKDCPNPSNAPSFKHEGSIHKPFVNPPQTNRGTRPKNTQAAGTRRVNQSSGQKATAHAYAMRQKDDQDGQDVVVDKFGLCVFTLFDPGSTHSYICSSLVLPGNVKSVRLDFNAS
ncbi:uncharacterized protein LOC125839385 [Solanum verrucosum]|uniref:uncharacterized protein LOC125839385 n=1 Tax=Solanum verrucosum TaxID=315347 RepID=UPI0020D09B75|nr:uncharacterized protein LOC125839385 [Solanum verrucosum]